MHTARRLLVASLLMGAIVVGAAGPAHAICERATWLAVSPSSSSPGHSVTVQGEWFFAECVERITARPATGIQIVFEQDGVRREIGVVDAVTVNYGFTASVEIPGDAVPGTATITAESAPAVTIAIIAATSGAPSEGPAELPHTGGTAPLALLGMALVAAGLATTRVSRLARA